RWRRTETEWQEGLRTIACEQRQNDLASGLIPGCRVVLASLRELSLKRIRAQRRQARQDNAKKRDFDGAESIVVPEAAGINGVSGSPPPATYPPAPSPASAL